MAEPLETIFEEREELMVSPTGGNPTLRKAHFLKPSVSSIDGLFPKLPSPVISAEPTASKLKNLPLKVQFKGWQRQNKKWKMWVESLHSKYQSVWKKAGIYKAIMCSTCYIQKHPDLILGLAEKWCPETNTFIFPWGEATVTLEDMIFLCGYSVLGDSVLSPLDTKEMVEIHAALIEARKEAATKGAVTATNYAWLEHFMGSGSKLEHEAFLSFWLSMYVFPTINYVIDKQVLPIAIHLSRGAQIALAPAVLSSIYRDLDLLKVVTDEVLTLFAPFQLVQLWAWERFPTLRPSPKSITYSEPRPARWHKLKNVSDENMRLAMDSAGECFQWRPYATALNINWLFPKFYGYEEQLVSVDAALDKGLESFARCLRVGELVGLDCIEQYLPHRVAMQFGMDQDLPARVARYNESPEIAWSNYNRSIGDATLYLPPRLFESDVTTRYLEWWKQSMSAEHVAIKPYERWPTKTRRLPQVSAGNMKDRANVIKDIWKKTRTIPSVQAKVNEEKCHHFDASWGLKKPRKLLSRRHFSTITERSHKSQIIRDWSDDFDVPVTSVWRVRAANRTIIRPADTLPSVPAIKTKGDCRASIAWSSKSATEVPQDTTKSYTGVENYASVSPELPQDSTDIDHMPLVKRLQLSRKSQIIRHWSDSFDVPVKSVWQVSAANRTIVRPADTLPSVQAIKTGGDCRASVESWSFESANKLPQGSTQSSNSVENHAPVTPDLPQDSSDIDDHIPLAKCLKRSDGLADKRTTSSHTTFQCSQSQNVFSSSILNKSTRQRKWATTTQGILQSKATPSFYGAAKRGKDVDFAQKIKRDTEEGRKAFNPTKNQLDVVGSRGAFEQRKIAKESVKSVVKEGKKGMAEGSFNNPIDVDDYMEDTTREIEHRALERRVHYLEKLIGVVAE